ncbi:MAG: hypothetical protein N2440_01965 [Actinobacteria bacterium]|nr:hypothetical protein [Actinomycetota bacterium]
MSSRRQINKPIFIKKRYSFKRDLFLLILVGVLSFLAFYRLILIPVFDVRLKTNDNLSAVFEVNEITGQEQKKYVTRIWILNSRTYVEVADYDTVTRYIYNEDELLQESQGKIKRLERALNPFFFPYSNSLLEFLKRNSSDLKNFKLTGGFIHLGRKCLFLSFRDSFKLNRSYKFLFDEQTGFPLSIEVKDGERIIYKARAIDFSDELNATKEPFHIDAKEAVDSYPGIILEAEEVQNLAPFTIYPPTWAPPELKQMRIMRLNRYRAPFSALEIKKDLILFSYYDTHYFVHIVESRGKFNLNPLKKGKPFKVNNREFNTAALPCALAAWTNDRNTFLLIVSNIEKEKIVKVAEGLFE